MNSNNRVKCKVCLIEKVKTPNGYFNHKDRKFVDEHGKTWNGKTCPECNKLICKSSMRNLRAKRRDENTAPQE